MTRLIRGADLSVPKVARGALMRDHPKFIVELDSSGLAHFGTNIAPRLCRHPVSDQ